MSEPHFFRSGLGVTGEVYNRECLPKVARFINNCIGIRTWYFGQIWPQATIPILSIKEIKRLGTTYIPKEKNPPNAPQLRPIQGFWANLKRRVYANNYIPKNLDCLKKFQHYIFRQP